MSEQQIKEYLQKYNITSKELLASHIEELKRNTIPNTKLISELVWVLEDFFFSFFERSSCPAEKSNSVNDTYKELKKCSSQCFCDGSCKKPQKYNFGLTEQLNTVVGNLEGIDRPPQKSLNTHVSEAINTKLGEYARTELEPDYRPPFFLDEVIKASEFSAEKIEKILLQSDFIDLDTIKNCKDSGQAIKCNESNCYFCNTSLADFLNDNPQYFPKKEENNSLVFPKNSEIHKEGIKESNGKITYEELDWDYIDLMALRMSKNLEKYPPKNWQKKMDIKKLAEASIRHARKIIQEIENDEESLQEHATALGCNGMMINYQLKNNG